MTLFVQTLSHPNPRTTGKAQSGLLWRREQDIYTQEGIYRSLVPLLSSTLLLFPAIFQQLDKRRPYGPVIDSSQGDIIKSLTAKEVSGREQSQLTFPFNLFPFYYLLPGKIDTVSRNPVQFRFNCSEAHIENSSLELS